uniref:Uncharacterized protein n=1 Tax=Arundo donax TaxID=35708 RepID=A0A0A8ZEJ1_ARUDO
MDLFGFIVWISRSPSGHVLFILNVCQSSWHYWIVASCISLPTSHSLSI